MLSHAPAAAVPAAVMFVDDPDRFARDVAGFLRAGR